MVAFEHAESEFLFFLSSMIEMHVTCRMLIISVLLIA